ncbi:MAG: glycosyltransferase family 2 protein [Lachnospiraceae bacterium]|nr:glycosyltransferase family 2 protein [Lachnospiraceae bacterium]
MNVLNDGLYVVMPAYNEEENIREVVLSWYRVLEGKSADARLVVADSGSTDRTHEILSDLKQECPKLLLLPTKYKEHGPKLIALYRYAYEQGAEFVFQTDSDGQTLPEEFEAFWEKRHAYDGIIGDRRVRGDGKGRAFIEGVVCLLLKLYFHVDVPDGNAPFRLMKSEMIKRYLDRLPEDYNIPNIMLTTYFAYYRENICFSEITFHPRLRGENKIDVKSIIGHGLRALKDFHAFKKGM